MHLELLKLSQEVNASTGESTTLLALRLPSGENILAVIGDSDAGRVAECIAAGLQNRPAVAVPPSAQEPVYNPPQQARQQHQYIQTEAPGLAVHVFGGTEMGESDTPEVQIPAAVYNRPIDPRTGQELRTPLQVTKNEAGYPVVHGAGMVDPASVVGASTQVDEDGVGQG